MIKPVDKPIIFVYCF